MLFFDLDDNVQRRNDIPRVGSVPSFIIVLGLRLLHPLVDVLDLDVPRVLDADRVVLVGAAQVQMVGALRDDDGHHTRVH